MAWTTVFLDGFDHYSTTEIIGKWTTTAGGATIDTGIFRNTGRSLKLGTNNGSQAVKSIDQARNFCIGFGMYMSATPPAATITDANGEVVLGLGNAITGNNSGQVGLAMLNDGKLHAVRGSLSGTTFLSGTTELGVGTTVLSPSTWYYIEIRAFIDNTAGQLEVRVNGVTEVNLSGIDTQHQTFDYASVLAFAAGSPGGWYNRYIDDLYIRTSSLTTAEAGGFLGDIKVKPYYPNADGTYSQFTPSTGTVHFSLLDEVPPVTTDYVSSSTALQKDSYGFQDVAETGSIKAVQLCIFADKDDAGFRAVDPFVKSGATEDFGTSESLSTTKGYKLKLWEKDPNTAADWSQAALNAAEFGQRISATV